LVTPEDPNDAPYQICPECGGTIVVVRDEIQSFYFTLEDEGDDVRVEHQADDEWYLASTLKRYQCRDCTRQWFDFYDFMEAVYQKQLVAKSKLST